MYPAKLDEKGRIKVPSVFQEYLSSFEEKKLFVTSLDRQIAHIYPISAWRQVEEFFEKYTDDPESAENVAFTAADLGSEAEMDSQGRILFSSELRRALGIENKPVHIFAYKGHIEVLSEELYEERVKQSSASPKQNLKKLQTAGMK
jgi:MraZ protein